VEATRPADLEESLHEGDEVRVGFPEDRIWVVAREA